MGSGWGRGEEDGDGDGEEDGDEDRLGPNAAFFRFVVVVAVVVAVRFPDADEAVRNKSSKFE